MRKNEKENRENHRADMRERNREKGEDGMVMIEAVYVVVITIMVIFFAFNLAAVYHNRIVLTSAANEAAGSIGNSFGGADKDPFYAYMAPEDFKTLNPYRYFPVLNDWNSRYNKRAKEKARAYAAYLVYESEFSTDREIGKLVDDVTVKRDQNGLGMQVIHVTVKRTYPVFIMNPVSFFGLDPKYEAEAAGTAVCYDVIYQMNAAAFVDELQKKAEEITVVKALDSVIGIIENVMKLWTTVTGSGE